MSKFKLFFRFFFCNCSSTVHPLSQNLMRFDFVDYKIFCGGHFYAKKLHLVDFVNSYCFQENYPKRFLFPVDLRNAIKMCFQKIYIIAIQMTRSFYSRNVQSKFGKIKKNVYILEKYTKYNSKNNLAPEKTLSRCFN